MRIPTIIAATLIAVSPLSAQSVAHAQSTSQSSVDADTFEFRWDAFAGTRYAAKGDQIERLRSEARAHCSEMAERGIEGYSTRREFEVDCARMIEREAVAQLAQRSRAKEKGARLARRPSSK